MRLPGPHRRRSALAASAGAATGGATPLALLHLGAVALPQPLVARIAERMLKSIGRTHPRLLANLAALDAAVVHVLPIDLPYGFALRVGPEPALRVVARGAGGTDATIEARVAALTDLLEARIDGDTLFFRRDLRITGNTAVIVALRNVLDRETLSLADEIAAALGPLGGPARGAARRLERLLERCAARAAALHRALHPQDRAPDAALGAEVERCRAEIAALTARIGRLEARRQRRDEHAA